MSYHISAVATFIMVIVLPCKSSPEFENLWQIPGVDPDLIHLLANQSIGEPEFYHRLMSNFHNMSSSSTALSGRAIREWVTNRDDEIAFQYISESKSWSKKLLHLCNVRDDCRPELDGICFGGQRMSHLCHIAEPTSLIAPELLIQRSGDDDKNWISIDTNKQTISKLFSGSRSIVIVIHGFRQSHQDVASIHDALVNEGSYDMIVTLDYKFAARAPNYARALVNSEIVGYKLFKFIRKTMSALSISGSGFYLIGFSLGTQVAHFAAGYLVRENILLDRITGLDPSAILTKGIRLSHKDASFVDVIHTSAGSLTTWPISYLMGQVGTRKAMGHIDFYPNGGGFQPFCRNIFRNMNFACHHLMAIKYFVASIQSCPYSSYPCQTAPNPNSFYDKQCPEPERVSMSSRMGFHSKLRREQSLWTSQLLYTSYEPPFCEIRDPCTTVFSCSRSRYSWPEESESR